jgi:transcriptional regulator with XRE-family HTH domain
MDLSDKIKQILTTKNISPSHFADEIGIQRSSMSHILAGRNKPSLDIVQKIIKRFPDLGVAWILDDENLPVTHPEDPLLARSEQTQKKTPEAKYPDFQEKTMRPSRPETEERNSNHMSVKPETTIEKKVDRVMIFYTDGTFQEYRS